MALKPWRKPIASEPLTEANALLIAAHLRQIADETREGHRILTNTVRMLEEGVNALLTIADAHETAAEKIEAVTNSAHAHEK